MTEELEQLLKNLKLRRILEIYDEQLRAADKDDISYTDFVTRLVRAQWQAKQEGALEWRIRRANLPEKESRWFGDIEDAIRYAEKFRGHDLYVGLGLARQDYGPKRRCPSDEVGGIVGVCADLDLRSEAHPKPTLPETTTQALSILPEELPASFVVSTGNGLQVWWLFREPYIFESDDDRRAAAVLMNRWHTLLRGNATRRGWSYDRLADLARVLRVPGTTNCKDPSNPKPVVIQSQRDQRYNPSELADYLDDVALSDPEAEAVAAQEWSQRFHDKPLTINLSARIPEDRIRHWLQVDPRFCETWFRQRHDLHDQSQSGYDLALACFGFGLRLNEQEIVDLIVHHRALHREKQRTRLDYFQRTISKAATSMDGVNMPGRTAPMADPNNTGLTKTNSTDPVSRSKICANLSAILGVQIRRLTKISGNAPIFHMELEEGTIEFSSVVKLIGQTSLRNTIAARTQRLIPWFKPKKWEEVAQLFLDACEVEEGGEEMEIEGAARLHLGQYLSAASFITSLEGEARDTARKPMIAEGLITICSSDFRTFINKTTSDNLSIPAVVSMLSAVGAKSKRFRGKFPEQSRWLLPQDKFALADYAAFEGWSRPNDA